jgi:hypothetical protein
VKSVAFVVLDHVFHIHAALSQACHHLI